MSLATIAPAACWPAPMWRRAALIVLATALGSPRGAAAQEPVPGIPARGVDAWAATIDSTAPVAVAVVPEGRAERARPFARLSASAVGMLDSLMLRAREQIGTRYVFGAATPGKALDCSSFARYVMSAVGITLPRTAAQQARLGTAVPRDRAHLRPGDLLTFSRGRRVSHVGIYLGEGRFIHASPSSGRVIETTFDRNPRLLRRWAGARRLLAVDDSARAPGGE